MNPLVSRQLASFCLSLALSGSLASLAQAEEAAVVYRRTLGSTAWIYNPKIDSSGTGWVVDRARRLLITNQHVVDDATHVEVLFPAYRDGQLISERSYYKDHGRTIRGRVMDAVVDRDLALIQLDSLPPDIRELPLAASSPIPGEPVYSIGNPGASGALWVFTSGDVRAVYRKRWSTRIGNASIWREARVVETSSPTNPGDSGGPVVNTKGEVVGVTEGGNTMARLVSTSIDVADVREFLAQANRVMEPRNAADYFLRGCHFEYLRLHELAIEAFSEVLRLEPRNALACLGRGNNFVSKQDYDTAIADYSKAIEIDPRCDLAYHNRGIAYRRKQETERAIPDFTRAIQLRPTYAAAYLERGNCYTDKGLLERAIADFRCVINLNDAATLAWGHNGLGLCLARKQNFAAAAAEFTKALSIEPYVASFWDSRAWVLLETKQYEEALPDLDQALKLNPAMDSAWHRVGRVYFHRRDYTHAIAAYSKAILLNPAAPFTSWVGAGVSERWATAPKPEGISPKRSASTLHLPTKSPPSNSVFSERATATEFFSRPSQHGLE
jgi:tetratricopeptide (TPR) repeat protein